MNHTILVYGTLRPFTNTDVVLVPGRLYDLGWFPGIVLGNHSNNEEGESFVVCERIEADDEKLAQLDSYEGYYENNPTNSLYLRVKHGEDWIYVYNHDLSNKQPIASGDWERHKIAMEEEEVCN